MKVMVDVSIISTSVNQVLPGLGVSNTIRRHKSVDRTLAIELGEDGITVNNILPDILIQIV